MKITDTAIRYAVVGIVAILFLGLGYASFSGKEQDKQFFSEQVTYNQALQYIQEEQYDQALPILQQVEKKNPKSTVVKYYLGTTLANTGEWSSAVREYQNILDLNPYKVEDAMFMIQFANVLINADKLEEAKLVLERCQTLSNPDQMPDYQEQVNALLMQISEST